MKKVKIIIVDDSLELCRVLSEALNSVPEFEVIKAIVNPLAAAAEIRALKPDILLLDVIMPQLDGDDILEDLHGSLAHNMGIIVLSPINNDMTISRYSNLGAHYFIPKPVNMEKLVKKIKLLEENILRAADGRANEYHGGESAPSRLVVSKITKILLKTGVNPKFKGFCFIRESINYLCSPGNELTSITKIIYPRVAMEFGTESEKVERAIRTAIEKAFQGEDAGKFYYETLCSSVVRKSQKSYPSNREFIFTIAEYIKNIEPIDMIS